MESSSWVFELGGGSVGTEQELKAKASRFASAIVSMFANPALVLAEKPMVSLLYRKRYLSSIVSATEFRDFSHLLELLGEKSESGETQIKTQSSFHKFLAFCDLESAPPTILNILKSLPPNLQFPFWQSLIDREVVLEKKSEELRWALLEYFENIPIEHMATDFRLRLINNYMFCSYLNYDKKHHIKRHLNRFFRHDLENSTAVIPEVTVRREIPAGEKPILLVASEVFRSDHAMYRCYSSVIQGLKSHFHVVCLTQSDSIDSNARKIFDEVRVFEKETGVAMALSLVKKINPDAVYFPSIGMQTWVIYLSVLRLAPVQFMTLGHPATTMSPEIDYVLFEESMLSDPECFSEKVVLTKEGTFPFKPYPTENLPTPNVRELPDVVDIAVPASLYKINDKLLRACELIATKASKKVRFHFFPGVAGLHLYSLKTQVERRVNAVFYPKLPYDSYMEKINACDLQLSPFPFGNTNGFVDGITLGLPIVCLDGAELHSRSDLVLSERVGLPEFCRAQSIEEYVAAVVRLVDDDLERSKISNALLDDCARDKLYSTAGESCIEDFSDAAHWLYLNHERLQREEQKVWSVSDRLEMQ